MNATSSAGAVPGLAGGDLLRAGFAASPFAPAFLGAAFGAPVLPPFAFPLSGFAAGGALSPFFSCATPDATVSVADRNAASTPTGRVRRPSARTRLLLM